MERAHLWLLWTALALPALTADAIGLNEPWTGWQQAAGLGVLTLAVALSRRAPLMAFGLTAALSLALTPALFSVSYALALVVLALLLGLRAARVRPSAAVFGAVGCAGTAKIALVGVDPAPEWVVLTSTLLFGCVFPWLGGRHWRQSRELAVAGWTRAARLEGEREVAEERARLRERARIAQDMHDSLGHELSLLALRAAALQVAPGLPDEHRPAVAALRAAAADATDRLHRIIGVLREADEPVPLIPAGESVEQLVARAAESGMAVRWEGGGERSVGESTVRVSGQGAAVVASDGVAGRIRYRVVREALTNVARHAPGAPVVVAVDGAAVTVINGRATLPSSGSSGGSGLAGLRAAVTAVGGEFEAGAHGEGFRVRAYVPEQAGRASAGAVRAPAAPVTVARTIAAAACAGVVLVGGAFGWYAYTEKHSVLEPSAYAGLRVGTPADQAARVLPDRTARDAPVERAPEPPRGAECRYYRASGELFVSVAHFRLCFDGDRLVAKDVIPTSEEFVR